MSASPSQSMPTMIDQDLGERLTFTADAHHDLPGFDLKRAHVNEGCIEVPSLWGMRVQAEGLLMMHPS